MNGNVCYSNLNFVSKFTEIMCNENYCFIARLTKPTHSLATCVYLQLLTIQSRKRIMSYILYLNFDINQHVGVFYHICNAKDMPDLTF